MCSAVFAVQYCVCTAVLGLLVVFLNSSCEHTFHARFTCMWPFFYIHCLNSECFNVLMFNLPLSCLSLTKTGIKIVAPDIGRAIAGTPVMVRGCSTVPWLSVLYCMTLKFAIFSLCYHHLLRPTLNISSHLCFPVCL